MGQKQTASHVLMVEPVAFCANPQTMDSNAFQSGGGAANIAETARAEARALRHLLMEKGVTVTAAAGQPSCPDDLFCNNWVSTHENGCVVLYPMAAANRRAERREDIIGLLRKTYPDLWDLTASERKGKVLESTGSLVLDRVNKIAYAATSSRTDPGLARQWCERMGYSPVLFPTADRDGQAIYHTNVIMFIGTKMAGICAACIPDETMRNKVLSQLRRTHEIIEITLDQVYAFAGNMLEVRNGKGESLLLMSETAYKSLTAAQIKALEKNTDALVYAPIPTIEKHGGGSVRCMLLELFDKN